MKKRMNLFAISSVIVIMFVIIGCDLLLPDSSPTAIVFESAVQTGGSSETTDSTALTLVFDVDPTTLTASDITVTGATKGALTGSGTTRSLAISQITVANGETVSVAIENLSGYVLSGSPKTAVVWVRSTSASNDADLSGLSVSAGSLSPEFTSSETSYLVSVPYSTTSIVVTGIKSDSNAAISSNNGVLQNLIVGINTIIITITASDGITTKDYTITIVRNIGVNDANWVDENWGYTIEGKTIWYFWDYSSDLDITGIDACFQEGIIPDGSTYARSGSFSTRGQYSFTRTKAIQHIL